MAQGLLEERGKRQIHRHFMTAYKCESQKEAQRIDIVSWSGTFGEHH